MTNPDMDQARTRLAIRVCYLDPPGAYTVETNQLSRIRNQIS